MPALVGIAFHFLCLQQCQCLWAQTAGRSTLAVYDFSTSARTASLGMDFISVCHADLNAGLDNPSLIGPQMSNWLMLNYVGMLRGGNFGSLAYVPVSKRFGTFLFSLRFNSYGNFTAFDEEEHWEGTFTAADYQFAVAWGLTIDSSFSIGATFKPTLSQYESYTAFALAFDMAGTYSSPNRLFSASLLARNIGAQVVTFNNTPESLPFELAATMSYKLLRAPFRLFLSIRDLQRWQLAYNDPLEPTTVVDPFTGEVNSPGWFSEFADNLGRHFEVGAEVYIGKMLFVDLGYSYRQGREMRSIEAFNLSALSFGIGLRTKRMEFVYARNNYHLAQAPNHISLSYRF